MNIGESTEIWLLDPEADYGDNEGRLKFHISYIGEVILMSRNEPCFCGSGRKTKHCHPSVNEESLVSKILELYAEIDERNKNATTLCEKGCSYCCTDDFEVNLSEFLVMLDFLGTEQSRYATVKDIIANGNPKANGTCIFLNEKENTCEIYALKPLMCRNFGTTKQATSFPCKKLKVMSSKYETLFAWFNKLDENGVLKSEKMRQLLKSSTNGNIDYFIETMMKQQK